MDKSLQVFRTFEDGRRVSVGRVETIDGNVVFHYAEEYLATFPESVGSLSPLTPPTTPPLSQLRKSALRDSPVFLRKAFRTGTASGSWTNRSDKRACRAKPSRRLTALLMSETVRQAHCPTNPSETFLPCPEKLFRSRNSVLPPKTSSRKKRPNFC